MSQQVLAAHVTSQFKELEAGSEVKVVRAVTT